jgi:hypothetical protein
VVNAVEDGIWLANQIYDKALLRFGQGNIDFRWWSMKLPPEHKIDYRRLCRSGRADSIQGLALHLRECLPALWKRAYSAAASHTPNILHVECGTFEYICDSYSGIEALGEAAFDQRVRDRVVGVLGISLPMRGRRRGSVPKGWVEHPEEVDNGHRDKGHFIAHAIGGGLDMNVFSQARGLNRGISEQGKVYRLMERYCYDNAGTFCFSRPVYDDATSIPQWVEFGLLRDDCGLWVEVFENWLREGHLLTDAPPRDRSRAGAPDGKAEFSE